MVSGNAYGGDGNGEELGGSMPKCRLMMISDSVGLVGEE